MTYKIEFHPPLRCTQSASQEPIGKQSPLSLQDEGFVSSLVAEQSAFLMQ